MRTNELRMVKMTGLGVLSLVLGAGLLAMGGCKSNSAAPIADMNNGPDPAAANMAPASSAPASSAPGTQGQVLGQEAYPPPAQVNGEQYPETGADQYSDPAYDQSQVDQGAQALYAQDAPPPLPDYEQPELTEAGYMWTPGYWAYGPGGYYWVPGAWVAPPYTGALWTPAYWGYCGHRYCFHGGYWGQHIGFYGGISYGFGYFGHGYEGGYWNGGNFYYNQRLNRVNVNDVRNVYTRNVPVVNNRVSYNGPGGVQARPLPAEAAVLHERRTPPMQVQVAQVHAAVTNRQQAFAENHGKPAVAVAQQHFAADRTPPAAIEPRGAEAGRPGAAPAANPQQIRAQQEQQEQQKNQQAAAARQGQAQQQEQQRTQQQAEQQRSQQQAQQQRSVQEQQQRTAPEQRPERVKPPAAPQRAALQPERQQPQPERAAPRVVPMRPTPDSHPAPAPHPPPPARPEKPPV